MDYINSLSATQTTIAAASLVAVLSAIAMGLFGKNQMPVEGKVCMHGDPQTNHQEHLTDINATDHPHNRGL
jgi:hypothetical protein